MIKDIRKSKDPYCWSYHNDLIAATSKELKYHVSLGSGELFDQFLQQFYAFASKPFSPIHFLCSAEASSHQPSIGMMTSEVGLFRLLEHPVAKEFTSFVPWMYRQSFCVMHQLISQIDGSKSLPEMYKNIEDLRWINHKLSRRGMLEEVIYQLTEINLSQFWEAIPSDKGLEQWLSEMTVKIKRLMQGEVHHIKIYLPCNQHYVYPALIFWLQLFDTVMLYRHPYWKIYWNDQCLLFFNAPHTAMDVLKLYEPETVCVNSEVLGPTLPKGMDIPLIKLLTCWGEALKLQ